MIDMSSHISHIDSIDPGSQAAVTGVLAAVLSLDEDLRIAGFADPSARGERMPDGLKEWLEKLVAKVKEIVEQLTDVASFTITIGSPFTVTASVTFAKPQGH